MSINGQCTCTMYTIHDSAIKTVTETTVPYTHAALRRCVLAGACFFIYFLFAKWATDNACVLGEPPSLCVICIYANFG